MQRRPLSVLGLLLGSTRRRNVTAVTDQAHRAAFAEPLEERLLMALSRAAGGSGYSGTLSTNPATRQQQLICDPNEPLEGSTSVLYDASLVTINHAEPGPGYRLTGVLVAVEPVITEPPALTDNLAVAAVEAAVEDVILVPLSTFQENRFNFRETGYIQVKYVLVGDAGQLQPQGEVNDEAGVDGVDTHALFFDPVGIILLREDGPSLAATTDFEAQQEGEPVYTYTIFAAQEGEFGNPDEDFLRTTDGVYIGPDEISPAVVTTDPVEGKPVVSATAPAETANGPVEVTLSATDPSPADEAAGFTYLVDFGDGSPLLTVPATADNGAGVAVQHDYADVGVFTITVRAVDQHGEVSDPFTTQISIGGVELRPDPSNPSKLALYVRGTGGDDVIRFDKAGNGMSVSINGQEFGPFYGFDRVIAYGLGGNDDIRMNAQGAQSVLFFGGSGNDLLVAGNGPSILSGGDGADTAVGGAGSDLLVGGRGGDDLAGNTGDDILVAGRTSYDDGSDDDVRALTAVLNGWTRGRSSAGLRPSGANRNVFDDGAADRVAGGQGRDLLLLGSGDQSDLARNETSLTLLP